jgi:hypothetical protein
MTNQIPNPKRRIKLVFVLVIGAYDLVGHWGLVIGILEDCFKIVKLKTK